MVWAGNNQEVWNAAFNGALAGMFAQAPVADSVAADAASYTAVAKAFAVEVDAAIATNGAISTGANGTTVVASAGVNAATQQAYVSLVTSLCFGYWFSRSGANLPATPPTAASFAVAAAAINALVTASQTVYTAAVSLT